MLALLPPGFHRYWPEKGLKEGPLAVHPLWFQLWRPDEVAQFNEEYQFHKFAPGFIARARVASKSTTGNCANPRGKIGTS